MRYALLLLASVAAIGMPMVAVRAQPAEVAVQTASEPYAALIAAAARRFAIPAAWIRAIMRIESHGDRHAISPKGAMGLMQIMPDTWAALRARYGFGRDPFDPQDNIMAGAAFLREMHDRYGSPGFLAAYNAGPTRYEDYLDHRAPLPPETLAYVAQLLPLLGNHGSAASILATTADSLTWTRAPIFVVHSVRTRSADQVMSKQPPSDASTVLALDNLSTIAPQSGGLFVSISAAGPKP